MSRTSNSLKPTKREIAEIKVLHNIGYSENAIGQMIGKSNHTIKKYLNSELLNDNQVKKMIDRITAKEVADLNVIGLKSRQCQHIYLNAVLDGKKEVNPIAVTAIGDRTSRQRRLLENKPTSNLEVYSQFINKFTVNIQNNAAKEPGEINE